MDFNNTLSKLLGNDKKIDEVQVDKRVIDEIVKIAINADPEEYVALLSGKVDENILKVTGLIFLPFEASDTSAVMKIFMMPLVTDAVGSVHSHPGPSAQPSNADLTFFGKNGYFHMIICRPYSEASIKSYDTFGNPLTFTIKDLGDEVEIKDWNDLDIDEELLKELEECKEEDDDLDIEKTENSLNETSLDTNTENIIEPKEAEIVQPQQAMFNLQLESNGQIINQQIPLPPEYEPGDEIEVDIRTDRTPGDTIDEIILNVKKSKENMSKLQKPNIQSNSIQESSIPTNSEDIDDEIRKMEEDIAKLKEENQRLRDNMDK